MVGNSSDESDSDYPYSKIKPEWFEAQKTDNFDNEEWPNTLPSVNGTSSGNLPEPCVENILKLIRGAKNIQNGYKENAPGISADDLAKISSTIDKRDLENIIGSVLGPKSQQPPPPLQPQRPQPPPPPPPPQQQSSNNNVSTT